MFGFNLSNKKQNSNQNKARIVLKLEKKQKKIEL